MLAVVVAIYEPHATIRTRVPRFSIPAGISYTEPGVISSTAAVIVDWTSGWLLP